MTEGHFIFGDSAQAEAPAGIGSGPNPSVFADIVADALADPAPDTTAGGQDEAAAQSGIQLRQDAPRILMQLDIQQGIEPSDERLHRLVQEATGRGIRDVPSFTAWVSDMANGARSAGYRLNLDSLLAYLSEMQDAQRRFTQNPARLQ